VRYIVQAVVALALLIALPLVVDPSATDGHLMAAIVGALVLVALAIQGVVRYVRSRKPRSYADSIMPPAEPPKG